MALFLSRKEENELARSNKKVKETHHAFDANNPNQLKGHECPPKLSVKDKLLGEIPGAYS